jgi:regulator of protease activity HflC (stomatin/prohibitin superfamily)
MGFDISISWKISPLDASWIYSNISDVDGDEFGRYRWIEENIIRPNIASILPLTVSNYTPIEVYSMKRQDIQNLVEKRIKNELLANYKLIVTKVDIREVFYNKEYEQSITNKKLAEQEALRLIEVTKQKEEMLKQETINKDIAIQKAMGESEALKIKGQSITNNPKIIQLEWINKWNGVLPYFMSGSSNGIMFNMNMDNNN